MTCASICPKHGVRAAASLTELCLCRAGNAAVCDASFRPTTINNPTDAVWHRTDIGRVSNRSNTENNSSAFTKTLRVFWKRRIAENQGDGIFLGMSKARRQVVEFTPMVLRHSFATYFFLAYLCGQLPFNTHVEVLVNLAEQYVDRVSC